MSIFKCKMCGGTIEFEPGATVGICEYCGTKQTLPRLDDDRRTNLYDRANHFRRNNEFDKAAGIYDKILNEDTSDAEAYWSLVLCRYGIEYVEDPATRKRVPTVNRTQFTSVFDDDNYKSAIQCADAIQRSIYEAEANAINEIQKDILAISQQEEPFDVFICYKETDAAGRRTPDSVLANDLYHQLTNEGFKVFFSRITLEDKIGTAYEPYIFAALNSAKVMVVLGTKPEHFNAAWVRNEWSRYLNLVSQSGGKKVLIPAYRDMDPYNLPEEFSHLQAQDMSKLGFMQDLLRGIKKIIGSDEPKVEVKETVVGGSVSSVAPLLKRAFMFLEDGEWSRADDFCEQVLNQDPENAQAYLGKLMAELKVCRQPDLANCDRPFDHSNNYQKAVRFGDDSFFSALRAYIDHINERNENARLTGIYNDAVSAMKSASSESSYKSAAASFKTITGFKDADSLAEQCLEKADAQRKLKAQAAVRVVKEGIKSKIQALQSELNEAVSWEQQLTDQRSKLGIFAGKERKRIDIALAHVSERKSDLAVQIDQNQKTLEHYTSDADISATDIARDLREPLYMYLKYPKVAFAVNKMLYPTMSRDSIAFGQYFQKKRGSTEPIEWQVLARENDRILVISRYVLDYSKYTSSYGGITWENCTLRKWLNDIFLSEAFSEEERARIPRVIVSADENPDYGTRAGNSTTDQVFLLSITEANKYFSSSNARMCALTAYAALEKAAHTYDEYKERGETTCRWWLRSPGCDSIHASCISEYGYVDDTGRIVGKEFGVRPALWIKLGS